MRAPLIAAVAMAASAHAVVKLDRRANGAGELCPATMEEYLKELDGIFDRVSDASSEFSFVGKETAEGSGKVYKGKLEGNRATSFVFESKFEGLNEAQWAFLVSLYDDENARFSPELDPTFVPGASRKILDTTGAIGVKSALQRTEFEFIEGFPLLDRELVFLSGSTQKGDDFTGAGFSGCKILGNPSVSDRWIWRDLKSVDALFAVLFDGSVKVRGQNLWPSGDRLCLAKDPTTGLTKATLSHLITTDIGGLIGATGIYESGAFDGAQEDAYQFEAQALEDKIGERAGGGRREKRTRVVDGPGKKSGAASKSAGPAVSREEIAVQQVLSRAIRQGPLPGGVTATGCEVKQDVFASLYVACSLEGGQAQGLDRELFRRGIAALLNVPAERIDGIASSGHVVRFLVGSVGYKAQVDAASSAKKESSCAERWAIIAGLVLTVVLLAVAVALHAGVLRFRAQSPQAEAGSPVSVGEGRVSLENLAPATEMKKTVLEISPDAENTPTGN